VQSGEPPEAAAQRDTGGSNARALPEDRGKAMPARRPHDIAAKDSRFDARGPTGRAHAHGIHAGQIDD